MLLSALVASSGCGDESCLRAEGGEACEVAQPCSGLEFECADRSVDVRVLEAGDRRPGGTASLASPGDYLLSNSRVEAVIEALDHPHDVTPTGGGLLDLATRGDDNDSLSHLFQGVGFLPGDTVSYDAVEMIEDEGMVGLQLRGRLEGYPDVPVYTRFELHACEPGLRVRTEVINRSTDSLVWGLVDGWYWSGKETLPFAPGRGRGFDQPGLVLPLEDSFLPFPYMAAASHSTPSASYTCVPCNVPELWGFQTEQLTATGHPPRVVPPGDWAVYERFIGVADGRSLVGSTDIALEVRRQLRGEPWTRLSGRVVSNLLGDEARATVIISQGRSSTPVEARTPWTQVTPDASGSFTAGVPADRDYVLTVEAFGRPVTEVDARVARAPVDVGDIGVREAAEVELTVTVDGELDHAQVFVHPADQETEEDVSARLLGGFYECAPLLGAPHGPSPACNRVLVDGPVRVALPPGSYDLFATAGPFVTMATESVELLPGEQRSLEMALERLPLRPAGTLSGDFHVHGAPSFDSSIPDIDRVRAFLAAGIDVIAATDHDVSHDYAVAMEEVGANERMALMAGVETTGHILFDLTPGADMPQVIGHWNYWPIDYDPDGPWRGAVWDELAEPGLVMTRMEEGAGWSHELGVVQLNHPWDAPEVGRDLGFPRALGVNALEPLPDGEDGTGAGVFVRTPPGADYANSDYHVQEVINGTAVRLFLAYRAFWFYLLNQGLLRAGTANSDSHGMTDNVVGTPRNLVWSSTTVEAFDEEVFNAAIRAGHMIGTNGPVIEVSTLDASGDERGPGLEPVAPAADATLTLRVTAAPWVPVEEVRIVVNGEVARVLPLAPTIPDDPFDEEGLVRFDDDVELAELLPADGRDAWVVVEAGAPLVTFGDLDCNGIPDTSDNNGDGEVDWRDVDRNGDDEVDDQDIEGVDEPSGCSEDVGPLDGPPAPARDDLEYPFRAVTRGGFPLAFTNPLVFDIDGGGFDAPGRR